MASGAYRRVINDAFAAYSEWWKGAPYRPKDITTGILPGDFSYSLPCGDKSVGIVGLNTAFLQLQGGDYQGKLAWDARQLQAVCGGAVDDWLNRHSICLLLSHQGPDWLNPEAQKHGESEIAPASRFAVHLFGHMHETAIEYVRKGGNPNAVRLCQGCSVFGMELFGEPSTLQRSHGYSAGRIQFNKRNANFSLWPRIATNKTGPWRFIPDHIHAHLQNDQGTVPETLSFRQPKATSAPSNAKRKPIVHTFNSFAPHSTLPARRAFFGRKTELETIAKFLQPGHVGWGVVLDGPGGIGKTALALEAAHLAPAEHYPLKLFVSAKNRRLDPDGEHRLQDNRVDDYFALLTEIGLALGHDDIQRSPQYQRAELVRHALSSHRALLVLDNLESFTREERRRIYDLLEILPPTCRAIITSRRRDETAARTLRLDKLDIDAAKQLLTALGEHSSSIAKLSDDEQQRLYAETGGNPLLLTWTAGQLGLIQGRCRTVDEAVERLREAHRLKQVDDKNDPLEFIFGDLLDTFTDYETVMLAALAHFTDPARLAWLLPLAELSETAALTALDDLRDRALLIEDETHGTWFLPPLAARFLRLRRPEAVSAAGQRLEAGAYAFVLDAYEKNSPFNELEAVWPTVRAALPLLIAGDNTRLQTICTMLENYLQFAGLWGELFCLSQEAEAKALASGDYYNAGWRSYQKGMTHYRQGDADFVSNCAVRCADYWQKAGAGIREQAIIIHLRGRGLKLRKDYPSAIKEFEESLKLLGSISPNGADMAIDILNDLSEAKRESGDLTGAEIDFSEAMQIRAKLNILREGKRMFLMEELIASNNLSIARSLLRQNFAKEALPLAKEAVSIFIQLRHPELADAEAILAASEAACSGA